MPVQISNGVTLDYADAEDIQPQYYAFLLNEDEFDSAFTRIQGSGLTYYADPFHRHSGEINRNYGGRGVYFNDPDGHNMELSITTYPRKA